MAFIMRQADGRRGHRPIGSAGESCDATIGMLAKSRLSSRWDFLGHSGCRLIDAGIPIPNGPDFLVILLSVKESLHPRRQGRLAVLGPRPATWCCFSSRGKVASAC
jgi:hypothetical protein